MWPHFHVLRTALRPWLDRFLAAAPPPPPPPPRGPHEHDALLAGIAELCRAEWIMDGPRRPLRFGVLDDGGLRLLAAHLRGHPEEAGWWSALIDVLAAPLPTDLIDDLLARHVPLNWTRVSGLDRDHRWTLAERTNNPWHLNSHRFFLLHGAYEDASVPTSELRRVLRRHFSLAAVMEETAHRFLLDPESPWGVVSGIGVTDLDDLLTSALATPDGAASPRARAARLWAEVVGAARAASPPPLSPLAQEIWRDTLRFSRLPALLREDKASRPDKEDAVVEHVRGWPHAEEILRTYRVLLLARFAGDPNRRADELDRLLSETLEPEVLRIVAAHPNASLSTVWRVWMHAREAERERAEARTPEAVTWAQATTRGELYLRQGGPVEAAHAALVRRAARRDSTPAEVRHLYATGDGEVRFALACNANTPRDTLEHLTRVRKRPFARRTRFAAKRTLGRTK